MDRNKDYIIASLEQHLFFARIMKEHAFFLTVGLLPPPKKGPGPGGGEASQAVLMASFPRHLAEQPRRPQLCADLR